MSGAKDANGLTVKQEAFVHAFLETGNASEAYRKAYSTKGMAAESIRVEGQKLLAHPTISLRVEGLRTAAAEKAATKYEISVDTLTRMLLEDRDLARANNDAGNAVKAVDALGKLHGLVIEKKHVTSDNRHHHKPEPVSETAAWVAGLLGGGADGEASEPLPN